MKKLNNNSGQIVLMVLLTMVVGLTIALGIFADSLTDTALTISQENSEKAFNMAEAGIENLLAGEESVSIKRDNINVTGEINKDPFLETYVKMNETVEIKLTDEEDSINVKEIDIYWTDKNDSNQFLECGVKPAGIIMTIISEKETEIFSDFLAYNANKCFDANVGFGNSMSGNEKYLSKITLNKLDQIGDVIGKSGKLLRIKPVFNNTSIKVDVKQVTSGLPDSIIQQYRYVSLATANETMESRKIEVIRTLPSLSEIFDYTLFSNGRIN